MNLSFRLFSGLLLSFLICVETWSQEEFSEPVITSPWTDQVDKSAPHQEYPRPQMKRDNWVNLNGQWD